MMSSTTELHRGRRADTDVIVVVVAAVLRQQYPRDARRSNDSRAQQRGIRFARTPRWAQLHACKQTPSL